MTMAVVGTIVGGKMINYVHTNRVRSLLTIFIVISFIVYVAIYTSQQLGIADKPFTYTLIKWTVIAMAFMILDT